MHILYAQALTIGEVDAPDKNITENLFKLDLLSIQLNSRSLNTFYQREKKMLQGHCIPFTQGGVNMLNTRILQMFFMFFDPENWCAKSLHTLFPQSLIGDV